MTEMRLRQLAMLAGMIRDAALQNVAHEAQGCARLQAQIAALVAPSPPDPVVSAAVMDAVALHHARWADSRRRQLNEHLALRTAALLVAREKAQVAFARAQVLERLGRSGR
jgi:hypothetical protein